jgi:hypothetical protein
MKFTITKTLAFLIISSTIARPTPAPSNPALVAPDVELPPSVFDAPIDPKAEDDADEEMSATAADSVVPSTEETTESDSSDAPPMEDALGSVDSPNADASTSSVELSPAIEAALAQLAESLVNAGSPDEDVQKSMDNFRSIALKAVNANPAATELPPAIKSALEKLAGSLENEGVSAGVNPMDEIRDKVLNAVKAARSTAGPSEEPATDVEPESTEEEEVSEEAGADGAGEAGTEEVPSDPVLENASAEEVPPTETESAPAPVSAPTESQAGSDTVDATDPNAAA